MRFLPLTVSVKVSDILDGNSIVFSTAIASPYRELFEPAKVCDDQLLRQLGGSISQHKFTKVVKMRENFAAELSAEITKQILTAMSDKDTYNGYLIKEK